MSYSFEASPAPGPSLLAVPSLRLSDADERASKYIDSKIVNWFIEEVFDPTVSLATSRGHAQRFIDALFVTKPGFLNVQLAAKPLLTEDGRDLFQMLEEGWGEGGYDINPQDPDGLLVWTGGKYGPGRHAAKKVRHPGFPGYHLFDSVKNWGFMDKFFARITSETTQYMEAVKFR